MSDFDFFLFSFDIIDTNPDRGCMVTHKCKFLCYLFTYGMICRNTF